MGYCTSSEVDVILSYLIFLMLEYFDTKQFAN